MNSEQIKTICKQAKITLDQYKEIQAYINTLDINSRKGDIPIIEGMIKTLNPQYDLEVKYRKAAQLILNT